MRKLLSAAAAMGLMATALWSQTQASDRSKAGSHAHTTASKRSLLNPASLNQKAPDVYKVKFTTTQGAFMVQVTRGWAPLGADRFYNLVKNGFYTDASFFRVLPGFVVQFGISSKPAVARAWSHAAISDDPVTQSNKRGYLTFATAGPNTRTTQVFINLTDNAPLDGQGFSAFGQVVEGMDVVDKLYSGYGEGAPQGNGPDQGRIAAEGKPYLDKEFPKLDSIKSATIIAPAPPASKPATKAGAAHKAATHSTASTPKQP